MNKLYYFLRFFLFKYQFLHNATIPENHTWTFHGIKFFFGLHISNVEGAQVEEVLF